jgi:hypothetical protein
VRVDERHKADQDVGIMGRRQTDEVLDARWEMLEDDPTTNQRARQLEKAGDGGEMRGFSWRVSWCAASGMFRLRPRWRHTGQGGSSWVVGGGGEVERREGECGVRGAGVRGGGWVRFLFLTVFLSSGHRPHRPSDIRVHRPPHTTHSRPGSTPTSILTSTACIIKCSLRE